MNNTVKKTISIDAGVLKEAVKLNSNFSAIVEIALERYLQQNRLKKAIQSFGKWEQRTESSVDIVNELRRKDNREEGTFVENCSTRHRHRH